jgi:hypothetical protein
MNHHPDATIFQFIILTFIYSSTCFGCFPAHHQELLMMGGLKMHGLTNLKFQKEYGAI